MATIRIKKTINSQMDFVYEIYCNDVFMVALEGPVALSCAGAIATKLKNNDKDWKTLPAILEEFTEK